MELLTDAQRALFEAGGCLADYDVLKPIGKGKFSVVFKAQRRRDGVAVALKKIAIFDLMDARAREKTLKEVRLVQSVEHENIVQYLDAFLDGKDLYIAFEWADAGDLKRQIRKANERQMRLDERTIWRYFGQICSAILHLHRARIMHRDLKPANILLTTQGTVKVGDLGLGRHLSENTLEAHSKVGTPLYMSPEVLKGEGYDWKSDVWSLGCILYELAMLRSPFKAEGLNLYGLFQKINKGDYEAIPDSYSDHLRALVTQMISLDATRRPTMEQVWAACQTRPNSAVLSTDKQPQQHQQPDSTHQAPPSRRQNDPSRDHKTPAPTPNSSRPSSQQSDRVNHSRPTSSESTTQPHRHNQQHQHQTTPVSDEEVIQRQEDAAMELLYERLKLLAFMDDRKEIQKRLTRHHFTGESRSMPPWTRSTHERFKEMLRVAKWLLQLISEGAQMLYVDDDDDSQPPVVQVQKLLLVAEQAGVYTGDVARISAASLTKGYGLDVCILLNALSGKALEATGAKRQRPLYTRESVDTMEADDQWEVSADDQEHGSSTCSDEATTSTPLDNEYDGIDARWLVVREPERCTGARGEDDAMSMIHTRVDATAWLKEVERVQGKLHERWRECENNARHSNDQWLTRLDRLRREVAIMRQAGQPTSDSLRQMAEVRKGSCEQIEMLETRLQSQFEGLGKQCGDATERLQKSLQSIQGLQLAVGDRANALGAIHASAQSRIQQLEALNARVTDSSPLLNLKTQLKRLHEDNATLRIQAEVARAQVWRAKGNAASNSASSGRRHERR